MKFTPLTIEGAYLIEPEVFKDERGTFRRNFCLDELSKIDNTFKVCQGNISENLCKNTMRGFHYQRSPSSESKVITPITGAIFNVIIDLRKHSKTFLKIEKIEVFSSKYQTVLVPSGCANAFLTLERNTFVQYYMGDFFKPDSYRGFRYDDPYFKIKWPHEVRIISKRDLMLPPFTIDEL
jgi:dTDP-4-dehydrorhamnose 3,5-epimerase